MDNRRLMYNCIYAYTTKETKDIEWKGTRKGVGLIKIGQTFQDTKNRVKQQLQGSPHLLDGGYEILFNREALDINGNYFEDKDIFKRLKRMGVTRVPGTEWFECSLHDVEKAFEAAVKAIPLTSLHHGNKNVAEKRGVSYDKESAKAERRKVLNRDHILTIMKLYPDATSARAIAKYLVRDYNIKQYSWLSVATMIGKVINSLIVDGFIENKGSARFVKLCVKNKSGSAGQYIEKPVLKPDELRKLMNSYVNGVTIQELEKFYTVPSSTHEVLGKEYIKIRENNEDPRLVYRYYDSSFLPDYPVQDKDLIKTRLKYIPYRRKIEDILDGINMTANELSELLEKDFPKFLVAPASDGTLYVYLKERYTGVRTLLKQKKQDTLSKIKELLLKYPQGIPLVTLAEILSMPKKAIYRLVGLLEKDESIIIHKNGVGTKGVRAKVIQLKEFYKEDALYSILPFKCKGIALHYKVTMDVVISIIKSHPYLSTGMFQQELNKYVGQNVINRNFIAGVLRTLCLAGHIVFFKKGSSKVYHIADETHVQLTPADMEINIDEVETFVCNSMFGATTREIHSAIKAPVSVNAMYKKLRKLPFLTCELVLTEKNPNPVYKWYHINNGVTLKRDEVLAKNI